MYSENIPIVVQMNIITEMCGLVMMQKMWISNDAKDVYQMCLWSKQTVESF